MPVLVFSALSTTLDYKDILLTGHGTGGTEASIASVIFKEMFPDVNMHVITFGQTKPGGTMLAKRIKNATTRWMNRHDFKSKF